MGVGEFSLAISAGATIIFLTNFIGFTFYPYISNLSINERRLPLKKQINYLIQNYFFINHYCINYCNFKNYF